MLYAFFDETGRIESAHNDSTIDDIPDGAVALDEEQWETRFALRLDSHGSLVIDPVFPPLADQVAAAWSRIKAERDRRTDQGGYLVAGKWFHSDLKSRSQQLGLVALGAGIPPNTHWKTMDGSFVVMTPALASQVLAAAAAADIATFAAAEAHKAAMEASHAPADYDFSDGWPGVFEG